MTKKILDQREVFSTYPKGEVPKRFQSFGYLFARCRGSSSKGVPNIGVRDRFRDLVTGTGWTARRLAQKGASVTGVDIGEGVIAAARDLAEAAGPSIDFRVGDAEKVDLPDAAYDVITSSCGVIASRPEEALWGKTSDIWTFVGATIIVAAMTYIAHREARAGGRE